MTTKCDNCVNNAKTKPKGWIIRSKYGESVPNDSLGDQLLNRMRNAECHDFMIDAESGKAIRNKEVLEKSVGLAAILAARGINVGDRISIIADNRLDWIVPALAAIYVGAVAAPLNPAYTELEFRHMLNIAKPRMVFVSRRTEELVLKVARTLPWSMEIIELDDEAVKQGVVTLEKLLRESKVRVDPYHYKTVAIGDNSRRPAVILSSSGTTGLPKNVTLTHRNLLTFLLHITKAEYLDIRKNDKIIICLPFFHGYGMALLMMALFRSATLIMMRHFHPNGFLQSIQKYRVTHLPLVPTLLVFLSKYPQVANYDFSTVREVFCGSAPLPRDIVSEVKRRLKVENIRDAYGMTELSMVVCMADRSGDIGPVGYLLPNILCKVIDPETREILGPGQQGELCFKGECVMLGYYDNTEATVQTIDSDGWLHSGDLGYYDQKERLYVSGRLKELIKYRGFQISPTELEIILMAIPGVKDGAVVGKPDEISGELPIAFVVKEPGSSLSSQDIITIVNGQLSPEKWLRAGVSFIQEIPRTASGKVLRKELVRMIPKL